MYVFSVTFLRQLILYKCLIIKFLKKYLISPFLRKTIFLDYGLIIENFSIIWSDKRNYIGSYYASSVFAFYFDTHC